MPDGPSLHLYHFPGACSQVSICALEMAELAYTVDIVDLPGNAQSTPEYRAISPLGKVPVLVIDGVPLYENVAIISYVASLAPDAAVLPVNAALRVHAEAIGGLAFCSGTLHPYVRGVANPARMTTGDVGPVREKSTELLTKALAYADHRLAATGWWLAEMSIIDVYLNWAVSVARRAGFDLSAVTRVDGLGARLQGIAAFDRMTAVEARLHATLAA